MKMCSTFRRALCSARTPAAQLLATLVLAGLVCTPVFAQGRARLIAQQERRAQRQQQQQQKQQNRANNGRPAAGGANRPLGQGANNLPPAAITRLQQMTPGQQEKFLQNNKRFQNLPPQQQAQIRQRLQTWNKLTPAQQDELRQREQVFEQMTPQQRAYVTQTLAPRWQRLPAPRQQAILQRLHQLRDLSEADRNAKLNDPAFVQGLNAEDRDTLNQLAHLHVGMAPDAPPI
jgi:hypothetical protein